MSLSPAAISVAGDGLHFKIKMIELNRIYNEDCLLTMRKMADKEIDCVITDPPYNAGYDIDNDNLPLIEFMEFCATWIKEVERISKSQVYIIDPKYSYPIYKLSGGGYHHTYTHFKNNAMRGMQGGFANTTSVIVFHSGKVNRIDQYPNDLWDIPIVPHKLKHPTPKPEKLYDIIILKFTEEGQVVYDPFAGSGTIGVSAQKYKRSYIGSETVKEYYLEAINRIQPILF